MTLSTGGFRQVVAFPPAPIATGWSDPCREGLAPSQEPCLSTAHDFITTTPVFKFSVHTGSNASPIYVQQFEQMSGNAAPSSLAVIERVARYFAEASPQEAHLIDDEIQVTIAILHTSVA